MLIVLNQIRLPLCQNQRPFANLIFDGLRFFLFFNHLNDIHTTNHGQGGDLVGETTFTEDELQGEVVLYDCD